MIALKTCENCRRDFPAHLVDKIQSTSAAPTVGNPPSGMCCPICWEEYQQRVDALGVGYRIPGPIFQQMLKEACAFVANEERP